MKPLKLLRLIFTLLLFPVLVHGQLKHTLGAGDLRTDITVFRGIISGHFHIPSFLFDTLSNNSEKYVRLSIPGAFPSGEPGMPELPVISALVEANLSGGYRMEVLSIDSITVPLESLFESAVIFPAQPSVRKGDRYVRPQFHPLSEAGTADTNAGFSILTLEQEGKMRGIDIARLQFNPFRYDADRNELTIYHSFVFTVTTGRHDESGTRLRSRPFRNAVQSVIRDQYAGGLKRLVQEEPVTMVILSDTMFRESLQPLIQWKKEKGFRIIEAYTSDSAVGSTYLEIRSFMQSIYENPPGDHAPPSYLLIAGDVEHVPLSQPSGQITDLYYTTFDGPGDYLPEMFHGRISVKSSEELTDVVDKILMYEKYQFPDPSFLDRSILIAGYDARYAPVHGNGQINYAANYYFNSQNGIQANVYLHPSAASMDEEILQDIYEGAALVNYTGHGEYYGWLDPSFRLGHIDTMRNIHKFGLMIGNGCSTNQFNMTNDCFAEAIVKVKERGAVGYIGCTNDSYWDEDYYWSVGIGPIVSNPEYVNTTAGYYDKLFHPGNEPVEEWAPSLGEMIFAGNMTVQQSTTNRKKYYWEIYQLMGDPSLVPWFRVPDDAPAEYPKNLPPGATQVSVRASAYDYIALSAGGHLLHAMHADRFGRAYLSIPDTLQAEGLKLVITGDYRQPLVDTIFRTSGQNGYLQLAGYGLNAESVGSDGIVSAGESFSLDLRLTNTGNGTIQTGTLAIECFEDEISISDSTLIIGSIDPGDTLLITGAFRLTAADTAPDNSTFTLSLHMDGGVQGNTIFLKEKIHAPRLVSAGITWDDRRFGNGNGIVEPGERILFSWEVENRGSFRSDSVAVSHTTADDLTVELLTPFQLPVIEAGQLYTAVQTGVIGTSGSLPATGWMQLMTNDQRFRLQDSLFIVAGRHFEDFSTGDLSRFKWINGSHSWSPDSIIHNGSPWSLRSGNIPHNASSTLQIKAEVIQTDSVVFDFRVSSEKDYDYLKFFVDNNLVAQWSGETGWNRHVHLLEPGNRLLEWRYQKDVNTIKGDDAAWIDNIVFPAHAFDSIDIGILQLKEPSGGKSLGHSEKLRLNLVNSGRQVVRGFEVGYNVNGSAWMEQSFSDTIPPGEILEIELSGTFDMSALGHYTLLAGVKAEGDRYPGNDTLRFTFDHYAFPDLSLRLAGLDTVPAQYADVIIEVINEGNVPLELLRYTAFLNNEPGRSDTAIVSLEPGGSTEVAVRIISEGDDGIGYGWHEFMIIAEPDSVLSNNSVSGSVFWSVQSLKASEEQFFTAYPNPVTDRFVVRLSDRITLPVTVEFVSITGRVLYSGSMVERSKTFSSADLAAARGEEMVIMVLRGGAGETLATGLLRFAVPEPVMK
jgi:hypothetical protein